MQTPLDIGVDVAKDTLEIAYGGAARPGERLANEPDAIRRWLASLPRGGRLGVEATGACHERLVRAAHRAGLTVFVLNPKDTRHYARGVGVRAKTDRVDAALIVRLIAREHDRLHPYPPPAPPQQAWGRLRRRRHTLTTVKGTLRQSLTGLVGLAGELQGLMARLDAVIGRIDTRIETLIQANPPRRQQYARLPAIHGVGTVVGAGLTHALERTPFGKADAFVAFTGLDPRPADSGQHRVADDCPSADRQNCGDCFSSPPWPPPRPAHGAPATSIIGIAAGPRPLPLSSWPERSRALPGRSITTRPRLIPHALRRA
jgi:transposase